MNIGIFGGTFDPIHKGHLALALRARAQCKLSRVYFVPTNFPPHKTSQPVAAYCHRYAMTALATAGEKTFVPSQLEAPPSALRTESSARGHILRPNYTIDTVRKLKQELNKSDRLFFLIGIDAFRDIAKWHEPDALFQECDFIVASRPGYSLAYVANVLPEKLRPREELTRPFAKEPAKGDLVLAGVSMHLIDDLNLHISATAIRLALAGKRSITRMVPESVEEYIKKEGLYREEGEASPQRR
ncbi:MAG: nicotinate (nicotinamide) nucleotide adenylyltransferase [Acidobacteria bacterium]|nr:nicotinate (nicotinamide) nucleotide adenylyltransferase [Acidobacteriota bacterium]